MKYQCKTCGKDVNRRSSFCSYCGTNLNNIDMPSENKQSRKFELLIFLVVSAILLVNGLNESQIKPSHILSGESDQAIITLILILLPPVILLVIYYMNSFKWFFKAFFVFAIISIIAIFATHPF